MAREKKHTFSAKTTRDNQVNVGDHLEILTNGRFPATRHRVVVPADEAARRCHRQSFGFFLTADDDVTLGPLGGEEPAAERYGPVNCRRHQDDRTRLTYGTAA